MHKDIRDIVAAAEAQGFSVRYSGKGYPLVYRGDEFVAKLPQTPSDWRSLMNSLAPMKRAGFVLPGQENRKGKGKR